MKKYNSSIESYAYSVAVIPVLFDVGIGAAFVCLSLWMIELLVRCFVFELLLLCALTALVHEFLRNSTTQIKNRKR